MNTRTATTKSTQAITCCYCAQLSPLSAIDQQEMLLTTVEHACVHCGTVHGVETTNTHIVASI
jgi:hypothetical protein